MRKEKKNRKEKRKEKKRRRKRKQRERKRILREKERKRRNKEKGKGNFPLSGGRSSTVRGLKSVHAARSTCGHQKVGVSTTSTR